MRGGQREENIQQCLFNKGRVIVFSERKFLSSKKQKAEQRLSLISMNINCDALTCDERVWAAVRVVGATYRYRCHPAEALPFYSS